MDFIDVVRKIRYLTKTKKVGHAVRWITRYWTFDRCTGKFTKKINEYRPRKKEYTGSITLGATTPTYDLESEPQDFKTIDSITEEQIEDNKIFHRHYSANSTNTFSNKKDGNVHTTWHEKDWR